jgi:hypothetical protein
MLDKSNLDSALQSIFAKINSTDELLYANALAIENLNVDIDAKKSILEKQRAELDKKRTQYYDELRKIRNLQNN